MGIIIKSQREIDKMREAGRIVMAVLDAVEAACVPGVTTGELNRIAERELHRGKAESAFLGYSPGGGRWGPRAAAAKRTGRPPCRTTALRAKARAFARAWSSRSNPC